MERWRLLEWQSIDGPTSAALDETLLAAVGANESLPTLRFYTWTGSWLSLGSSQCARQDVDLEACRRLGVGAVRRLSGGAASLNERMVGFSLVAPAAHRLAGRGVIDTYRIAGSALAKGLAAMGLAVEAVPAGPVGRTGSPLVGGQAAERLFCFAGLAAYEVLWRGRKLVGHAQVRRRAGVVYHGLLLLAFDARRLASLFRYENEAEREEAIVYLETRVVGLSEALARPVEAKPVAATLAEAFRAQLGIEFERGSLTAEERTLTAILRESKYGGEDWTFRR